MAGAYITGQYRNLFAECGYSEEEITKRVEDTFHTIFYGSDEECFYHEVGEDMAYMEDTGNHDARTEGMSYGMMVCVQMNKKEEFDRLWKWTRTYMYIEDGPCKNYFAWSCALDGTPNANGPAPDGEEYFAMALFFASNRWGDGEGIFNYKEEARNILRECVHKGEIGHPGEPMWEPSNKLIKFITNCDFSDPSYHLPHFYDLFAMWADPADRVFWREAATASRQYLHICCDKHTGLSPEYADFNGAPHEGHQHIFGRHDWYYSDAYRTIANIAMDHIWFEQDPWQVANANKLQRFYCEDQKEHWDGVFLVDGTRLEEKALHPVAIIAVNAEASLAADGPYAKECVKKFWETPLRTGDRRYYDNFLYLFAMLALSGNYRIYDSGQNPLLRQDYPDPDVIRVEDTYYMISTTMHFLPGGVILRSYDLLHWEIASYVFDHLDDTPAQQLMGEENIYGKGMWAASLRYHKGTFYVCFVCNDTGKTYLYQSSHIDGPWKKQEIEGFYHDCSLLFDEDDRVYIVYGNTQVYLTELNGELTGPKAGGLHRLLVDDGKHPSLGYEGSHFYKIHGRYYLFLIHSLREEWYRTEACFSSDSLEGEFAGGDVLCDDMNYLHAGVAQGGIVDAPEGDWYAILFQDRGAVGRIPVIMPVAWDSKTKAPIFGCDGKVPKLVEIKSTRPDYTYEPLYTSDDFDYQPGEDGRIHLKKPWQWNHTPQDKLWSVTEREHALRLHAGKLCTELTQSYNTLTQRTMEPNSEAIVTLDGTGMQHGDVMGLAAFQGCYGAVALWKERDTFSVVMLEKALDDNMEMTAEDKASKPYHVVEQIALENPLLKVKCKTSFCDGKDTAEFFFEQEGEWKTIGTKHKLIFKLDHFTGCRYGLFYYSTEATGGYADFMNFIYQ